MTTIISNGQAPVRTFSDSITRKDGYKAPILNKKRVNMLSKKVPIKYCDDIIISTDHIGFKVIKKTDNHN